MRSTPLTRDAGGPSQPMDNDSPGNGREVGKCVCPFSFACSSRRLLSDDELTAFVRHHCKDNEVDRVVNALRGLSVTTMDGLIALTVEQVRQSGQSDIGFAIMGIQCKILPFLEPFCADVVAELTQQSPNSHSCNEA